MLGIAPPIAWKNTGVNSENTAGMKLSPIILNAVTPISITAVSDENICISWAGINSKHIIHTIIKLPANINESVIIPLHRP